MTSNVRIGVTGRPPRRISLGSFSDTEPLEDMRKQILTRPPTEKIIEPLTCGLEIGEDEFLWNGP
jgi:hypothetical protein